MTLKKLYIGLMVIAAGLIGFALYINWPAKTFALCEPIRVLSSDIKAGDVITWQSTIKRFSTKPVEGYRYLENLDTGQATALPEIIVNVKDIPADKQCHTVYRKGTLLSTTVPGNYRLKFLTYVRINRWNLDKIVFYSESFTIK